MSEVIIVTHIICMVASLVVMPTAIMLALSGIRGSIKVATSGFVLTAIGFTTGVILLLSAPLLTECVILTSYLLATIALYAYGFGWGVASKARLLRGA